MKFLSMLVILLGVGLVAFGPTLSPHKTTFLSKQTTWKLSKNDITVTVDTKEPVQRINVDLTTPMSMLDEGEWAGLISVLNNLAPNTANITLHVVGLGGDAILLKDVMNAMVLAESRGNPINAIVDGPAISAHAFLTCAASSVSVKPGGSLTFHHVGGDVPLFGVLPITYKTYPSDIEITNTTDSITKMCLDKNELSQQDITDINNGYRVIYYMTPDSKVSKEVTSDWGSISSMMLEAGNLLVGLLVVSFIVRLMYRIVVK